MRSKRIKMLKELKTELDKYLQQNYEGADIPFMSKKDEKDCKDKKRVPFSDFWRKIFKHEEKSEGSQSAIVVSQRNKTSSRDDIFEQAELESEVSLNNAKEESCSEILINSVDFTSVPRPRMQEESGQRVQSRPIVYAQEQQSISLPTSSSIGDFLEKTYEAGALAKRLNQYMYERDITTAMIYDRCHIDRKLISKITSNDKYHPSKDTILALCIGLRLNLAESVEFMELAGYSFRKTSRKDLIVQFMIAKENYDLFEINELLDEYHESYLGA